MPALARRAEYGWWATANWVDSCHGCLCQYAWVLNEQTNWIHHRRERMFPHLYSRSVYLSFWLFLRFHTKNGAFCSCVSFSQRLQRLIGLLFGTTFKINFMFLPHHILKFKHTFSFKPNRPSLCMLCVFVCVWVKWRVTVPFCFCAEGLELDTRRYRAYSHGLVVNLRPHWYSIVKPISLVDVSGRAKSPLLFLWVFSRGMKVCESGRCFVIRVVLRASRVVRQ